MALGAKEAAILEFLTPAPRSLDDITSSVPEISQSVVKGIVIRLVERGWLETLGFTEYSEFSLTERGKRSRSSGLLERMLIGILAERRKTSVEQLADDLETDLGQLRAILGPLSAKGCVRWTNGMLEPGETMSFVAAIECLLLRFASDAETVPSHAVSPDELELLRECSRGREFALFRESLVREAELSLSAQGRAVLRQQEGANQAATDTARQTASPPYDFHSTPPPWRAGRRHPYSRALFLIRSELASLGFEDVSVNMVTPRVWNFEALYMPVFHPAGDRMHSLFVGDPSTSGAVRTKAPLGVPGEHIASVHAHGGESGSRGWGYVPPTDAMSVLMFASQATGALCRLAAKGGPRRITTTARCFRFDKLDRNHTADFILTEGMLVGHEATLRNLRGFLDTMADRFIRGGKTMAMPQYHPFSEPSISVVAESSSGRSMEIGGGGILRPEVMAILGLNERVCVWWLNSPELAATAAGFDCMRSLYSSDLDQLAVLKDPPRHRPWVD